MRSREPQTANRQEDTQCFGSGFNKVSGSVCGSGFGIRTGSRREKINHKNRKKLRNCMFLSAGKMGRTQLKKKYNCVKAAQSRRQEGILTDNRQASRYRHLDKWAGRQAFRAHRQQTGRQAGRHSGHIGSRQAGRQTFRAHRQ